MRLLACHVIPADGTTIGIEWGRPTFWRKARRVAPFMFLVLRIVTGPLWGQIWLVWKVTKFLAPFFLIGFLASCASSSNRFDKSPCACTFKPANTGNFAAEGSDA